MPTEVRSEHTVRVHAPDVAILSVVVESRDHGTTRPVAMQRDGAVWSARFVAEHGDRYWLVADGSAPLLDPSASDVELTPAGPRSVVRATPWPVRPSLGRHHRHPVVYEMHVRGFGRTFAGVVDHLDHLVALGVDVIEMMPVHPFDSSTNYWGYMPIVWGAVHRGFAAGDDPAEELADLVAAAHERGIEVWLDVVFNHTGEGDATMPTWCLRGLDGAHAYRHHPDGRPTDDSGCGNDVDPADPGVRRLVLEALDRFADLGIDGFRFDLASLLTRDGGGLVRTIGDWAERRDVTLVAEAWDLGAYQVGDDFPDERWAQWNDRFRDDVRGFLRAEPGLVPAMVQRVAGSRDLFGGSWERTVNFVTAHDGLTLHDLMAVTTDRHRSWDCGPELRPQKMANAFGLLLLSAGTAMFVMGDEFARTQGGHDNPYDIDSELTWIDWSRRDEWADLCDVVRRLIELRRLAGFGSVRCYGALGEPDVGHESRSLAWATGDLYVIANMWWESIDFRVHEPGPWRLALSTADWTLRLDEVGDTVTAPARSLTVLARRPGDRHSERGE